MMSKRTKQCKNLRNLFTALHILATFVPLAYFGIYILVTGQPVQKVGLTVTIVVMLLLAVLSVFIAVKHRAMLHTTIFWLMVLMIGLCLNIELIRTFIIIMSVVSIVDECVFQHLSARYSELTRTNKEIDNR